MGKIKNFFNQLKQELVLWYENNKDALLGGAIGLSLSVVLCLIVCLEVINPKVFGCIFVSLLLSGVLIGMNEVSIRSSKDYYTEYPLFRKIKHFLIRFVGYPIILMVNWWMLYISVVD